MISDSNPGRSKIFVFSETSRPALGPTQPPMYVGSFPGIKRLGREVDHSPTPNAGVKNAWSYTATPPISLHGMGRENYT
jgi:hypothetical protein